MASVSGCSHQLIDLRLSDPSYTMDDSSKKLDLGSTTRVTEGDYASASTLYFSALQDEIKQSKAHWSTLVDHPRDTNDEMDFKMSNEQEFCALQWHSTWGNFFANFSGDAISTGFDHEDHGELVVGKKIAEGGQAELYEAHIKWNNPRNNEDVREFNREYVVKVFKEGTLLKHVKLQLPEGLLQFHVEVMGRYMSHTSKVIPRFFSDVLCGALLKSGRFAFLMVKEHFDLRTLIERKMKLRSGGDEGPFLEEEAKLLMYHIALGVEWLHNRDIVHRDLKASNVLVRESKTTWPRWECFVADYECSVGVVGTTFFRAPEILLACKERKVNERPEVFSRAADVYSYAMTCYEILTGKLPFEGHPLSDSLLIDLVINQQLCPLIPLYVEGWIRELLDGCWQSDPSARPRIGEILNVLSTNSTSVKREEAWWKIKYGKDFRCENIGF